MSVTSIQLEEESTPVVTMPSVLAIRNFVLTRQKNLVLLQYKRKGLGDRMMTRSFRSCAEIVMSRVRT